MKGLCRAGSSRMCARGGRQKRHAFAVVALLHAAVLLLMIQELPSSIFGKSRAVAHSQEAQPNQKKLPSCGQSARGGRGNQSNQIRLRVRYGTFTKVLAHAPFPYSGKYGDTRIDFFDYVDPVTGLRFHTNNNGERFSEREHYRDGSVLFHIPAHFNPRKPFMYVVFFHGILSDAQQCVKDYHLDEQIEASGKNLILVVPQLAKNAVDSSPGKLFKKDAFRVLMREAATILCPKVGKKYRRKLEGAPIVLAAFSGGYKAVASVLNRGGVQSRIRGVMLLDALYADLDKYEKWIRCRWRKAFLVNIYAPGSCERNSQILADQLTQYRIRISADWPVKPLKKGVYFIRSTSEHMKVPTEGPPKNPLTELLRVVRIAS